MLKSPKGRGSMAERYLGQPEKPKGALEFWGGWVLESIQSPTHLSLRLLRGPSLRLGMYGAFLGALKQALVAALSAAHPYLKKESCSCPTGVCPLEDDNPPCRAALLAALSHLPLL